MSEVDRTQRSGPSRREFLALGVGALAVAAVPLATRRRVLVRRTLPVMGTLGEVAVVHRDREYAHHAIDAAFARLRMVEQTMTRFTATSDVGRANRHAADEAVPVTRETATVLREGLHWAEHTDGLFDPALGRAVELWDVGYRTAPPACDAVALLAGRGLYRALDVDTWQGRPAVRFTSRDVAIDLGGIGKGYGVDEAVAVLHDWGIEHALVNVGGDLFAMGRSTDDDQWRIGIRSPDHPDSNVETIEVEDTAVATSGDYLQYFEHGGRRYHHLLDPATGAPREGTMRSLTMLATRCMTADAAATALFGAPEARTGYDLLGARVVSALS